jgi:hypothetical protein
MPLNTPKFRLIALLATRFQVGFFLGLFFDPENGNHMFLRNAA